MDTGSRRAKDRLCAVGGVETSGATMNESSALKNIFRRFGSQVGTRLFRNNVGLFWTADGRPVRCGLHVGSGDLIGWKTVTVTPEMVGKPVAVFLSVEVKTKTGRVSAEQKNWSEQVEKAGGIALIERL